MRLKIVTRYHYGVVHRNLKLLLLVFLQVQRGRKNTQSNRRRILFGAKVRMSQHDVFLRLVRSHYLPFIMARSNQRTIWVP